jgi:hypothetical protein
MLQKIVIEKNTPTWAKPYLERLLDIATPHQWLEADDEELSQEIGRIRLELAGARRRQREIPYRGLPTVAAVREAILDGLPNPGRSYWERRCERRVLKPNQEASPVSVVVAETTERLADD